jgi:hypothetical protein
VKNIYSDDLYSFTPDDVFQFCAQINDETQRLEFKRQIPSRKIGYYACAFANAEGGIIVVGLEDPVKNQPLQYAAAPPDVSANAILGINSAINAWVSPAIHFDIVGLGPDNAGHALVVVRVPPSLRGPHEYLGNDERRLPIRRGKEVKDLTLSEIFALSERRENVVLEQNQVRAQRVSIQPTNTGADLYFGIQITPATPVRAKTIEKPDDDFLLQIESKTRCKDKHVHEPLTYVEHLTNGLYLADIELAQAPGAAQPQYKMEFNADGSVTIRFSQRTAIALKDQYYSILLAAYYAAQKTFMRFGSTSQANVWFRAMLSANAKQEKVPQYCDEYVSIDLARVKFADAFADMVVRMFRVANVNSTVVAMRAELQHHADLYLPEVDSLPEDWTSAP